ncbi:MAG: transcriptional repressor [Rubrobacter sp.]|nr:transcriptional repressor [Rubrobacter sp.]
MGSSSFIGLTNKHHEHILCTSCPEVAPIPCCIVTEAQSALAASTGYLVSRHQVLFEGLCPTCSDERGTLSVSYHPHSS